MTVNDNFDIVHRNLFCDPARPVSPHLQFYFDKKKTKKPIKTRISTSIFNSLYYHQLTTTVPRTITCLTYMPLIFSERKQDVRKHLPCVNCKWMLMVIYRTDITSVLKIFKVVFITQLHVRTISEIVGFVFDHKWQFVTIIHPRL